MDEVNLRAPHIWLTQAVKHTEWNFRKLKYKLPCPFSWRGRRGDGVCLLAYAFLWYVNTLSTERYSAFLSCLSLSIQHHTKCDALGFLCLWPGRSKPSFKTYIGIWETDHLEVPCLNFGQQTISFSLLSLVKGVREGDVSEKITFQEDPRF